MDAISYHLIVTADQAIACLNNDDVVALRIRGRPYVERFERVLHRPGSMYCAEIVALDVVEVIYDTREPSWVGRNRVITNSLFLRPGDADTVRRAFPDCCE